MKRFIRASYGSELVELLHELCDSMLYQVNYEHKEHIASYDSPESVENRIYELVIASITDMNHDGEYDSLESLYKQDKRGFDTLLKRQIDRIMSEQYSDYTWD